MPTAILPHPAPSPRDAVIATLIATAIGFFVGVTLATTARHQ